jgi:hypothetical protein
MNVNFTVISRVLTKPFVLDVYQSQNRSSMHQYISYLHVLRKPMIQLGKKLRSSKMVFYFNLGYPGNLSG